MGALRFQMFAASLLALLLAGCTESGGGARHQVYKSSGKINFAGTPLADAVVTFFPLDDQPAALGRTNDNGEYTLTTYAAGDGAAAGSYKVIVTKSESGGGPGPGGGHDPENVDPLNTGPVSHSAAAGRGERSGSLLPDKYTRSDLTDLEATVTADGENVFNFDLQP